jgi:2-dehydro-3-deoxyphosphogluconate aldolase / (4S)-4-hydroxy-2-oxoglutarate aldolase
LTNREPWEANMNRVVTLDRILQTGVVAIVRLPSSERLLQVAHAVADGGVMAIEFTMTTPGAIDTLARASEEMGDHVVLGAGTVLDAPTARAAILAGARFVVAPTLSRETIEICHRYDVVIIPGAYTPTEILTAWEWGADLVKVFPATGLGPRYFKDVLAPLPQVRLVPTGGVDLQTAGSFIEAGAAAIAVGSNLVDPREVAAGDLGAITENARAFRAAVDRARGPGNGGTS